MALRRGWGKESRGLRFPDMTDKDIIEALCDVESGLRDSEMNFVDDVARQMEQHTIHGLTPDQRRWAEDIWERVK